MLCLCPGLELHTTSDSCAPVLRGEVEEVAPLCPVLPVFFIIGKLSLEVGKRGMDLLCVFLMLWVFHPLPFSKSAANTTAEYLQLSSPVST